MLSIIKRGPVSWLVLSILIIHSIIIHTSLAHSGGILNKSKKNPVIVSDADCEGVVGFTDELKQEIRSHKEDVQKIIDLVLRGSEKNSTYDDLAFFVDTFGPRMSGTKSLVNAIEFMEKKLRESKLDNVHGEKAMIPNWHIGEHWAEITLPVPKNMSIVALGKSVGTGGKPIEALVQIVHDFDELKALGDAGELEGKIVVYNYKYTDYADCVKYRTSGASEAAKYKAVATLVRSVGPFSINSPHAGFGGESIPTVAITLEDADLIQRWVSRDKKVKIKLFIDAENYPDVESKNLIGEIEGSEKPNEVVLISGHMDSWFNTQGAMDDGGGMMITYKAIDILRKLQLRAKRTVRAVLWTSEEFGLIGAQQYFKDHEHELGNFKIVMESDLGTFKPLGLSSKNMGQLGQCIVKEVLKLTEEIGTTRLDDQYEGSDIEVFSDKGVPALSLANENDRYFWFHHTSGDSMTVEDPDNLDKCTILWASASYVLADLSVDVN